MKCARCDFRPDPEQDGRPREQLAEHADSAGHALCRCCARSLPVEDERTCEACLTRSRSLLAGIVTMWAELPSHLGHVRASGYDTDRPSAADGRPLPGGDALVLAGPGGVGYAEDAETFRASDAPSVAQTLVQWEDDWRRARGDGASRLAARSSARVIEAAAGYLEVHTRWAARQHPVFDAYLEELAALHLRLERATGREERQVRAEAECFGCGADALVRQARPAGQCEHEPPSQELLTRIPLKTETPRQRDARLDAWQREHAGCEQGGFENHWTCQRCGETYDWARYLLAVSGRLQTSDVPGWGLPEQVAFVLGISAKTVRGWADRAQITTACVVPDKRLRVWWDDARRKSEELEARRERAARRKAENVEQEREAS